MRNAIILTIILLSNPVLGQSHRDSVDVCHYHLHLNMMEMATRTLYGCTELTVKVLAPANSIPLDFCKLTTDSVFVEGIKTSFSANDTLLRINQTVNNNDTIDIQIYYHGIPQKDPRWGGFYFTDNLAYNINVGMESHPHSVGRFWYPCIDNFTDRATYEYTITTKPSLTAVCSGLLNNVSTSSSRNIWHWQLNQDIPTYLASLAVGPFTHMDGIYDGINRSIPWNIYVIPEDSIGAIGTFSRLNKTLQVFEQSFGPYLWDRAGYVVVPFNAGAMEHATNIAFPRNALNGTEEDQILAAHELSHSWFGNLVTCQTEADMWLNEGWASYCESLFLEKVFSSTKAKNHIDNNHFSVLSSAAKADGGYFALNQLPNDITYGLHSYNKGADVVHTLRSYMGDSLFFKGVKAYLDQKKFDHANSGDLCQILSESTGLDLTPFFQNWVYQPGFPHYSIDSFTSTPGNDHYQVNLYMRQKAKARTFLGNKNRIPVRLIDNQWNKTDTTVEFDGEKAIITLNLPINPVAALIDPGQKVSDATTDIMDTITTPGNVIFRNCNFSLNTLSIDTKALVQVTNNWIIADGLNDQIPGLVMTNLNYWKIDGIFPVGFDARARFNYQFTSNTNADIAYTPSSSDTLVMLYRKNSGSPWQFLVKGTSARFVSGSFVVEHIKTGEYAIAYWDGKTIIGSNNNKAVKNAIVYPNPSKNHFTIELPENSHGKFIITDLQGNAVLTQSFANTSKVHFLLYDSLPSGVYYLNLVGDCRLYTKIIKL